MGALAGEGVSAAMMDNIITAAERAGEESRQSLTQLFQRAAEAHGVAVGEPLLGQPQASTSFAMLDGREEEVVAFQARVTDLTIVPHPTAGEDVASAEALHAVLFDSGRPVLLAPRTRPAEIGKRIAIAWNGLSTAAAALGSAMPFVRTAEAVRILSSPEYFRRGPIPAEVARYLAHHGVAADIASFAPIRREAGAGLLQAAAEFQADLMVMGAYSSSRLRQLILGGVTRYVLENADLPVLMNR
jgi:nucleotide-binding universal stress UspA family protein